MLVDTSLWVEHLRRGHAGLAARLEQGRVVTHPFVIGELACGHLRKRAEILGLLNALPCCEPCDHGEVMALVEARGLAASGLGWVDVHLLTAALVSGEPLWTLDARLGRAAARLHCQHTGR